MTKVLLHELGKSVSFGRLSLAAKVLWPMLLAASDDQGRGLAEPDVIKWRVCPNVSELDTENIPGVLQEMIAQDMIQVYEDGRNRPLYQIVRWWEYQQMQWAQPSKFDPPDGWIDRLRYTRRGQGTTEENWNMPGGFAGGQTEDIQGENPPENLGEKLPENTDGNSPGLPTKLNLTQSNSTKFFPGADAPENFPPTDNPDSISNDQPGPGKRGNASTGDYLGDLRQHCAPGASWTVPPEAGGRDSCADGPLKAFCGLVGMPLDSLTDKKRGQWVAELRRAAEQWQIPAEILTTCIEALPESEYAFKAYSTPYQESFKNDLAILIGRALQGESLVRTKKKQGRASPKRGGGRREYEPCSDAERQQA